MKILLKEGSWRESGHSNLDEKKIFYKGKPSFQKKKFTQQKRYLETKKSSSYKSNHPKKKFEMLIL
jgi:hypothetical protein